MSKAEDELTAGEMAADLEISLRQLDRLADQGLPVVGEGRKRRFPRSECRKWRKARQKTEASSGARLTAAQARRQTAEAKLAELRLARERGQLVSVSEVRDMQIRVNSIIRAKLLAIPAKMAPILGTNGNQTKVKALLEAEIREVLTALSKTKESDLA